MLFKCEENESFWQSFIPSEETAIMIVIYHPSTPKSLISACNDGIYRWPNVCVLVLWTNDGGCGKIHPTTLLDTAFLFQRLPIRQLYDAISGERTLVNCRNKHFGFCAEAVIVISCSNVVPMLKMNVIICCRVHQILQILNYPF